MIKRPWLERYDKGVPHHIDYPNVPLYSEREENEKLVHNCPFPLTI